MLVRGRKEIEDALVSLDIYTREEGLMVAARNLEVAQNLDDGTRHFCLSSRTYQSFSKHSRTRTETSIVAIPSRSLYQP